MNSFKDSISGSKSQQFTIVNIDRLFTIYKPKAPLSNFVDCFWQYEGEGAEHSTDRILPTGTFELAINLRENELVFCDAEDRQNCSQFSGAVVSGAHGRAFVPGAAAQVFIIGVHFKPAGAFPFLGVPACDVANTHVDLETLWGPSGRWLRERLCEASTADERFQLLEQTLFASWCHRVEQHYAVAAALETFAKNQAGPIVRETAKEVGLSQRRFIEVFKAEVGLTPKLFNRIRRFQQARTVIQQSPSLNWAHVALDLGYFDQSHLIHEFVEFSGLTPADYLKRHRAFIERDTH